MFLQKTLILVCRVLFHNYFQSSGSLTCHSYYRMQIKIRLSPILSLLCYFQLKHLHLKNIPKDMDDKALITFHAEQLFFSSVWSQSRVCECIHPFFPNKMAHIILTSSRSDVEMTQFKDFEMCFVCVGLVYPVSGSCFRIDPSMRSGYSRY